MQGLQPGELDYARNKQVTDLRFHVLKKYFIASESKQAMKTIANRDIVGISNSTQLGFSFFSHANRVRIQRPLNVTYLHDVEKVRICIMFLR